jgi:protein ImuB
VAVGERPVELLGRSGVPVGVTARGLLTSEPERLSVEDGPWVPVVAWSAPWPVEERWWSPAHRRAARLQVLTADEVALLLVTERRRWRVEATYD